MDALKFSEMLSDKHITNLKKLKYKYPDDFEEFINILKSSFYEKLPLNDFDGKNLVYLTSCTGVNLEAVKLLFTAQNSVYAANAVEEEIVATSAIESIDFDRSSVRSIMLGNAPKDNQENRIYGLKLGFEFISDRHNHITEENIHKLYMMAIGDFLEGDNRLHDGEFYRHDGVNVVGGNGVVHRGISSGKLPEYMKRFVDFANADDGTYAKTKATATNYVFENNDDKLETVVCYPGACCGPYDFKVSSVGEMVRMFLKGKFPVSLSFGAYNFVDVRDVAKGMIGAAEKGRPGEGYILTDEVVTVDQLIHMLADICGFKAPSLKISLGLANAFAPLMEVYYNAAKKTPLFTRYSIRKLTSNCNFSCEKAKEELGYAPMGAKQSFTDMVAWIKEYEGTGKKK